MNASQESATPARRATANPVAGPQLLTAREVARLLGLHEKTVYRWTDRNRIPVVRLGRTLRYRQRDIERWLASRAETTVAYVRVDLAPIRPPARPDRGARA